MAARNQQTHAKRARELALRERRERKAEKKALRAAGLLPVYDEETGLMVVPEENGDAPESDDAEDTEDAEDATDSEDAEDSGDAKDSKDAA